MNSSPPRRRCRILISTALAAFTCGILSAAEISPPRITSLTVSNVQRHLYWTPYPAAEGYRVLSATNVNGPYAPDLTGTPGGAQWTGGSTNTSRFYQLEVTPVESNRLFSLNLLNRVAYGPTPDDLEHLATVGPAAYLNEQLAPETISEPVPAFISDTTNSVPLPPATNWNYLVVTGSVSSSTLYMYLTAPGEVIIDDVQLRLITRVVETNGTVVTTNTVLGTNVLRNGDFEQPLTTGWTVSTNHAQSQIVTDMAASGTAALRMVATSPGSTQGSSIWQTVSPALPTTRQLCVLSLRYLPTTNSSLLTIRLSGNGTITSAQNLPATTMPTWLYATATGPATSTRTLYLYLSGAGDAYIDDMKLVAGSVPEVGPNLLRNGDFEAPLTVADWQFTTDFTNSFISTQYAHSGGGSLKIVGTGGGTGSGDSIYQSNIAGVSNGAIYTLSFWYLPATRARTLTARLSGSLLSATPDNTAAGIRRRLDSLGGTSFETGAATYLSFGGAALNDLRALYCENAVGSKRQLLQILTQFLENHFVTQHSKSAEYLDRYYDGLQDTLATDWEYREISRWQQALMRPDCTFYDLLKISAESPAMIVYLDTVGSLGNGNNVANENYARELFELFCMGVDNGYDQNDIVAMSRAWTGWSVDIVDPQNRDNPLAPRSARYGFYPNSGYNAVSNLVGVWTFRYKAENHGTNRAPILSEWNPASSPTNPVAIGPKLVPARYGTPWAGASYQLVIPPRTGTAGIQDGYDVIQHLANLPMTMEYISIKLCRLFVHDNFPNPTTRSELPEYAFYDYTRADLSPEARLVHDCMLAWWNSSPRGNMRAVLATIFNSELFRSHGGSMQKIKTPLEFVASAVRSVRSANGDGTFTASTDGYSFNGVLSRMGLMSLFNRADPDGYPENGPAWISAGTLAERLRFVQALCADPGATGTNTRPTDAGNCAVDPVALLMKKLPSAAWKDPAAIAEYFVGLLYPAEGQGNLELYKSAAVQFLNDGTADISTSTQALPFASLTVSASTLSAYDLRVRGMVGLLMTFQRFQEQ